MTKLTGSRRSDIDMQFERGGVWYGGTANEKHFKEEQAEEARVHLWRSPEKFYYPEWGQGRIRFCYRER